MRSSWRRNCNVKCKMQNVKYIIVATIIFNFTFLILHSAQAQSSVLDLNEEIQARKDEQRELQQKINQYSNKIRTTQRQAATLRNQISVLDANISKTELELRTKELEAEQFALEAAVVKQNIAQEEARAGKTRLDIGSTLRQLRQYDDREYLEIILTEPTFSNVLDQLYFTARLARALQNKLETISEIQYILNSNRQLLEENQKHAEELKAGLAILRTSFEQEKRVKAALFGKTKSTEAEFQNLLTQLREAAAAIDSEVVTLEKQIRERLDLADRLAGDTGLLSWPVAPLGGLSALFHDPDYPFRYLFEHSGVDIRAKQGTPVRAAASGYVAKAYNGGLGIRPSYVLLIHGNDLSTVYMHLSQINVTPEIFIARGDIVGFSGGTPRTSGAGRWSTGPHMHFETRLNGVPADPMRYLP